MFKRTLSILAVVILATLGLSAPSEAGKTATSKISCYTGWTAEQNANGTCIRQGSKFLLTHTPGYYAGVYVDPQPSLSGVPVKNLGLSYAYSGEVLVGSPRYQVPLGNGQYANVDTRCDANHDGVVNIQEPGCVISDTNGYLGLAADYTGVASGRDSTTTGVAWVLIDGPVAQAVTLSSIQLRLP